MAWASLQAGVRAGRVHGLVSCKLRQLGRQALCALWALAPLGGCLLGGGAKMRLTMGRPESGQEWLLLPTAGQSPHLPHARGGSSELAVPRSSMAALHRGPHRARHIGMAAPLLLHILLSTLHSDLSKTQGSPYCAGSLPSSSALTRCLGQGEHPPRPPASAAPPHCWPEKTAA